MTNNEKIEEAWNQLDSEDKITCIISTKGVLAKHHINDSRYIAKELMPFIREIITSSQAPLLQEIEELKQRLGENNGR